MLYATAIKLAVCMLRKVRGVTAIYLRRGIALDEITYGLSDIDLAVVVDDEKKTGMESAKEKVSSTYDKLSRFIPFFGQVNKEFELYSTSEFFRLYANHPFFKYRFDDGKYSWKLLFGRNIIKDLPELRDSELYLPATEELKTWWLLLSAEFSLGRSLPLFKRKYLWYKAIAEAAKVYLFVCCGEKGVPREAALQRVKTYLNEEQNRCIDQVRRYAKNLTARDQFVANDLIKLFVELTQSAFSEMERKVCKCTTKKRAILHSFSYDDLIIDKKISKEIEKIENYIGKELASYLNYIALIPQIYFGLDVLNNFDIDSMHVPLVQRKFIPFKRLRDLLSLLEKYSSVQLIEPLIKNGNIALSLQPGTNYEPIKSPKQYPLFFTLMNYCPLDIIKKPDGRKTFLCDLPPDFEDCIQRRVAKINDLVSNPDVYKMKPLDFLRFFWAATRTKLLNCALKNDHIYVPLISKQICDRASHFFPEDSEWLNNLHKEYSKELQGKESQAYRFFTESIDFLKRI